MELAALPSLMAANNQNWVQYLDDSGAIRRRSFAELHEDSTKFAVRLRTVCGVEPRQTIAICGDPSLRWLLAAVACVYLGFEIVAVPETASAEDHEELAVQAGATLLLAVDEVAPSSSGEQAETRLARMTFADIEAVACADSEGPLATAAGFSAVAFTSGSSSASVKAFRIRSEATESFIENFVRLFCLTSVDSWLVCHSFSHIVHLEYVLGGLCHGYNVTLTSPMRVMLGDIGDSPAALVTVPSVYQSMADVIRRRSPQGGLRRSLLELWLRAPVNRLTRRLARPVQRVLAPGAVSADWSSLKVAIIGAAPSGPQLQRFLILMGLPVYEGYGMSETQMLACNSPGASRFSTVGREWPGVRLRLSPTNELEARLESPRTESYLGDEPSTATTFSSDGWVRTGDLATVRDGYWSIAGRSKSLIVLSHGKNVNPEFLERRIADVEGVQACVVAGDGRPHVVALVVCGAELTGDETARIRADIAAINRTVAPHERIGGVELLADSSIEGEDFFTRSGKVRRAVVLRRFAAEISALYENRGADTHA